MLQAINPTVPTFTAEQQFIGYLVAICILAAAAVSLYRLRYTGLEGDAKAVKARVEAQLARQSPGTVRIAADEDPASRRLDIHAAFEAAGAVEQTTGLTDAVAAVGDAIVETYRPVAERLPKRARQALGLAAAILVVGTLAVNADLIIAALQSESGVSPVRYWPGAAIRDTQFVLAELAGTPFLGDAGALLFSTGILIAQWGFRNYWALAAILVIVAARLTLLPDPETEIEWTLPTPRRVGQIIAGVIAGGWFGILLAAGIGRTLADETLGRAMASAVSLLVVGVLIAVILIGTVQLLRRLVRQFRAVHGADRLRVLARLVGIVVAAIAAPLIPAWLVFAALNLPAILSAWLAASTATKAVTAVFGLLIVGSIGYILTKAADDARAAFKETLARNSVRVALGARGLPLGGMVGTYLFADGLGLPPAVGVTAAIVIGVFARLLWALFERVRYRAQLVDGGDPGVDRVVVHAYRLDTPDGTQWWARINGEPVAHPDRDAAAEAVIAGARDFFADGTLHPSVAAAHAEHLREDAVTEIAETETRLRSAVRRTAEGRVRNAQMLERDELEADLEAEYPAEVWEPELRALRTRGPLTHRDGYLFAD